MTKDLIMTRVAAIVSTLNETNGSPESMLYIFCEMNMDDYQTIKQILVSAGFVSVKSNYITLTAKGKEIAIKLDSVLKGKSNV